MSTNDKLPADAFHAHLDVCRRCANEPFNLCPTGFAALKKAARAIEEIIGEGVKLRKKI